MAGGSQILVLGESGPLWALESGAWTERGEKGPGVWTWASGTRESAGRMRNVWGVKVGHHGPQYKRVFLRIILQNHDRFLTVVASCGKVGTTGRSR